MLTFLLFISFILLLTLFARVRTLDARLRHMERYLQEATKKIGKASKEPAPQVVGEPDEPVPTSVPDVVPAATAASVQQPSVVERCIAWCKDEWLMKLGGLLILLGLGWFVSYAIAQGWIDENGRIAIGLVAGAAVLVLGWYRIQRFIHQGSILMFLGAAIIILTLFAARELYDMFTPTIALVLMFGTSCILGVTSINYKYPPLAYANVLLAAIAPFLIASADPSLVTLFTYLFVLAAASVWVTVRTGWRPVTLLALIVVSFYSASALSNEPVSTQLDTGVLFAYAFTVLFFATSVLGMRVAKRVALVDLWTALGSGAFLLMWILVAVSPEWQSMLLVVWTLVFAVGAFVAVKAGAPRTYFYSYAGVGVVYLGVATALELSGASLTIAAILEAALILWAGYRITGRVNHVPYLALPMLIPVLLSFSSIESQLWRTSILHEDAAVLALIIAVATGFGAYFYELRLHLAETERHIVRQAAQFFWIGGAVYATIFVWLGAHALAAGDTGTMAALILYTLVASTLFMAGHVTGATWQRYAAGVYIAIVVGRLLVVEIWQMALAERVVTFIIVGSVLMLVAWLERGQLGGLTATRAPSEK